MTFKATFKMTFKMTYMNIWWTFSFKYIPKSHGPKVPSSKALQLFYSPLNSSLTLKQLLLVYFCEWKSRQTIHIDALTLTQIFSFGSNSTTTNVCLWASQSNGKIMYKSIIPIEYHQIDYRIGYKINYRRHCRIHYRIDYSIDYCIDYRIDYSMKAKSINFSYNV